MTSDRWQRIKHIIGDLLDSGVEPGPEDLRALCQGDEEMAGEVKRLLSECRKVTEFLEKPVGELLGSGQPAFEPGQLAAGRYQIVKRLGEGGMGEVWEARDQDLRGKRVALKVLRSQLAFDRRYSRRLAEEVLLAREISHPNVCAIYDLGIGETRFGRVPFVVMRLVEGRTLSDWLAEATKLEPSQALEILRQVAEGLDAAHRAGIVHLDLKPGNVMVETGDRLHVWITDFGLASNFRAVDSVLQPAQSGVVMGTPDYMAPEQRSGSIMTNPAADIYSFGLLAYELVTGRLPSAAGTDPSLLPPGWGPVLTKCLDATPERRYGSAPEAVRALIAVNRNQRVRRKAIVAAAVLAGIAAAIAGGWRKLNDLFSPLPASKHAVVLPFRNTSGNPAWDPIAEGAADTIALELGRAQARNTDFWVTAPSDVLAQRVTGYAQARQVFGATLAIVGSLDRQGGAMRLHLDAIDTATGRPAVSRDLLAPPGEFSRLYQQMGESAISMLRLANRPDPVAPGMSRNPEAFRLLEAAKSAMRRQEQKGVEEAIAWLGQALDLDPDFTAAYAKLGEAYAARWVSTRQPELVDLALGTVGRAISQNRDPVLAQKTAASISNTFRQHSDALRHARQCLDLDRSNAECELFAAGALDGLGQASEAEAFYLKAIELWPHQWLFYNRLGSFYFRHARYADAEKMFRSTVQTAPWNPVGYTNLAGLFLSGGRFGEAAELLETSNRLRPTGAGLSNLGTSYFYLRRYSEAAAAYEKSVQLEPNRHEWWRNLGDAYAETAQTAPKAEGCYQRALALIEEENQKLENPPRENLAAEAVYRAKLHDAAGTRRALAAAHIAPNEPALCFRKAVALELIGDRNGALQAGEEALHAGFSRTEFERAPEMQQLLRDPKYIQLKKN